MISISELCDQHRRLEALATQLLAIVSAPVPDAAAVAGLRWRMARALLDHCRGEDEAVYDRLAFSGDVTAAALAERYRDEFGALSTAYGQYLSDWNVDGMNRNWIGFRTDTQVMMAALGARIEAEEHELYLHVHRIEQSRHAA